MAHRADTPDDDDLPPRVRAGRSRDRRQRLVILGVAGALGLLAVALCGGLALLFLGGRDAGPNGGGGPAEPAQLPAAPPPAP